MNIVRDVVKNDSNVTVSVDAFIDGVGNVRIPVSDLLAHNYKFSNAIVTRDGVVRGKNCSLPVVKLERNMILYHGSTVQSFTPKYGLGEDKHDYGRGFYLTASKDLACEWACTYDGVQGYLHTYKLNLDGLKVFNFNEQSSLSWLAELMSHRDADKSARYRKFAPRFIEMYKLDIGMYDVIYGWRADSSYFNIAKRFVRNEIDAELIRELFMLGDLDNQVCVKSKKAFSNLTEIYSPVLVNSSYHSKYVLRDSTARLKADELINSDRNTMTHTFDYCLQERRSI